LIEKRKNEHILYSVKEDVEFVCKTNFFEYVELVHISLPEINLSDVRVETEFLGYTISAPVMISGMTGGTELALKINKILARVAENIGVPIGVGSQRIALEKPETIESFSVVRKVAKNVPVIGNIGASQIVKGLSLEEFDKIGEMIKADAIAIHLNPLQEALQMEGEPEYRGLVKKLEYIVKNSSYPVIIKETGAGLSSEVIKKLVEIGVRIVDVGGAGGTSFSKIEALRAKDNVFYKKIALDFVDWGIPTAASIIEARNVSDDITLIATGGIRNGIDMVKALRLGADLCGVALPMIRAAYSGGYGEALRVLKTFIRELKIALFLTGSINVESLREKPILIFGLLKEWIDERKITVK